MSAPTVSVQLYSLREPLAADLPGTLARVREIGFEQVEPFGFVETSSDYAAALRDAGLTAPSAHASLVDADDPRRVLDAAAELGVSTVFEPFLAAERWNTDGAAATADRLNTIADLAAERGLVVGYHNHDWELSTTLEGTTALEFLAARLAPSVALEVDTYWAEIGGVSAPDLLRRLGDRVTHLHVKDGPREGGRELQTPAGQGELPVTEILAAAPSATRVVEFDHYAGDIFDGVTASLAWLRENDR